ncbi:translation factor [Zopfia rhizophila CBS 207.26]|uniref:Threonylcarbamoyl-AMP synthase n=1 Tax=Zopfia rhizophila CBS 207.26 TaxID=1314779 RepID=A0A6A6EUF6_9PEZI|nr:translation factor [Zopfia rhizophila CBS 207.26]
METDILPVDPSKLGKISFREDMNALIDEWSIDYEPSGGFESLRRAAIELASTDTPVAFPTETVYGLGADATRSSAVRAIFAAKGRPADNPLIVHVHSIPQLRELLGRSDSSDPIPEIYKPLIRKFWPGPLTIILPSPKDSILAPEVTAGLSTFGARMPRSILALALIKLAGVPLAAPSANASTRPSPTAAEHVKDDLHGLIRTIIDGGPCEVGVESTVVDGLSYPPTILRPGGVTIEQLRECPGWEGVVGYKDSPEKRTRPKAPGMKYRHYSPKATVVLYEAGTALPNAQGILEQVANHTSIGIIRTKGWPLALGLSIDWNNGLAQQKNGVPKSMPIAKRTLLENDNKKESGISNLLRSVIQHQTPHPEHFTLEKGVNSPIDLWDVDLGTQIDGVARGLFSTLRELDKKGVEVIFVEGIDDRNGGDIAAAVMNRLRKAAEVKI